MLIEFDGYHHYSKTSQINKDKKVGLGFCKWNKIDAGIYGLRIPYFVQLDKRMTKVWFNIDEQMNDYPHGFISKVCKLTDEFVWGGEKRFIKELRILPKSVSKEIIESLLKRFKNPVDIISDANIEIFIKEFLPELYDQYKDEINSLKDMI